MKNLKICQQKNLRKILCSNENVMRGQIVGKDDDSTIRTRGRKARATFCGITLKIKVTFYHYLVQLFYE